jgi:hypothetical protein
MEDDLSDDARVGTRSDSDDPEYNNTRTRKAAKTKTKVLRGRGIQNPTD